MMLGIGDGANDWRWHGISWQKGMQAMIASDFAMGHISCYWCMATVAAPDCLDFFYKNVVSYRVRNDG